MAEVLQAARASKDRVEYVTHRPRRHRASKCVARRESKRLLREPESTLLNQGKRAEIKL